MTQVILSARPDYAIGTSALRENAMVSGNIGKIGSEIAEIDNSRLRGSKWSLTP